MSLFNVPLVSMFICLSGTICAQTVITGRVTDSTGKGIGSATITAKKIDGLGVSAYGISNTDGNFKLIIRETESDSIAITITHLAYEAKTMLIPNTSSTHTVVMAAGNTMLREVQVSKLPPVSHDRDTIAYAVDAFTFKGDRVIGDIIKKLPGIEMEGDKILYQGKPIQQFKVNNLDLMGGRYAMINKNLPVDVVKKVQVIENDQPIKILDSLIISDRASLNLELKKFTLTGTGNIGAGLMPGLWDLSLTPMTFGQSFQMLNSVQSNNVGKDATRDLKPFYDGGTFLDHQANNSKGPSFLELGNIATPGFDETKWLDNKLILFSSNLLRRLKDGVEIRGNISYYNNRRNRNGSSSTTFYAPEGHILLTERISNTFRTDDLVLGVMIEKNEKDIYLHNRLNYHGQWNGDGGLLTMNQTESIHQDRSLEDFSLMNNLSFARFIGKQLVSIQSNIEIARTPQHLTITPGQFPGILNGGIPYERLRQAVNNASFFANNQVKLTHQIGRFAVTPSLGVNYRSNRLQSSITTTANNESHRLGQGFANDMTSNQFQIAPSLRFDYRRNGWQLMLSVPYQFNVFNVAQQGEKKLDAVQESAILPSFLAIYTADGKNELAANIRYGNQFEHMDYFYDALIVNNYRSMKRHDVTLLGSTGFNSTVSYRFKNALKATFMNADYSYSYHTRNYLMSNAIGHGGQLTIDVVDRDNNRYSHSISFGYSKLFAGIKTTVKVNGSSNFGKSDYLLNNSVHRLRSRSLKGGLELVNSSWDYLGVSYKVDYGKFISQVPYLISNHVIQNNHSLEIHGYFSENHRITLFNTYHLNNIVGVNDQFFVDAAYLWTVKKLNTDIKISALNIFDNRKFVQRFSDEYQLIVMDFAFRPRQFLISTHFRF